MAATSFASMGGAFTATGAHADSISDLKAKATALAARIDDLGRQEAALNEQYNRGQMKVQQLQSQVDQAAQQLAAAQASASQALAALKATALDAYVNGNASPLSSGGGVVENATQGLLRTEYVNTLATHQSDTIDQYHLAALQEQAAEANLKDQTDAAQQEVQQVGQQYQAGLQLQAQLKAAYNQDTGQIATLVAQQQAAAAEAARQAALARLAAQQAASYGPPPPVGHGASGAVAAAESRVGDWYSWGATGPNTFDCSGLVMWSYAQVGISLPHFSGAQYADTTHIPMSDLQPGDLVFPANPSEHVAMYVGNGMIVEAPYTGARVHVIPMSSWFVLASRVG